MISVIVPTCNEERLLPLCLESIREQETPCQIIVSDGASRDNTLKIAEPYADVIIKNEKPDLATQLNAGAASAGGDILLFLHADSRLTPGCLSRLSQLPEHIKGGAFTMQVEGNRFFYRILSAGGNMYCRTTGTYFGDRGLFVRADTFQALGGFAGVPIMTDVEFSRRVKKVGKTTLLSGPVMTSGRKFDSESPWRTLYLIVYALAAFRLNINLQIVKAKYYAGKPKRKETEYEREI